MSKINKNKLSNKIRTILLNTIDKEILDNSNKNNLLINSQNKEQLTKKFENYRDFAVECNESFIGMQNDEDNNIFFDLSCNYSHNKLNYICHSSKSNNECLFPHNFIIKSPSLKKINVKKIKNSKKSENNKLKTDSGQLTTEAESSFSFKEVGDLKNSETLSSDNNKKYKKKLSADLYNYSISNKSNDISKLINYCYNLKKPNDHIINEISDDDTTSNKENKNKFSFFRKIKNKHKHIPKKKLKKTINKQTNINKNNLDNNNRSLKRTKKNTINFTNEMKIYFDYIEKSYSKEKINITYTDKKLINIKLKEADDFHCKNIFQFHHCSNKPFEKKPKEKKLEQEKKSCYKQVINKKHANKKSQYLETHFNSTDNNPIILKHIQIKEKKEKEEKKDVYVAVNVVNNIRFRRKRFKSLKLPFKNNNEFRNNRMLCFGKKNFENEHK